jgi:hypothetical protein
VAPHFVVVDGGGAAGFADALVAAVGPLGHVLGLDVTPDMLAARHGRALRPDEPLAEAVLGQSLAAAGWELTGYDDPADHFWASAVRVSPAPR